jgi:hypothetical protein
MQSNALADSSCDFKSAVASMRIIVKDFSVTPDNNRRRSRSASSPIPQQRAGGVI